MFIEAKGLLAGVDDAPPNEVEKLKSDEPPPEPKANCEPVFWAGGLGAGLAGGKLCDCPKLKPFDIGCWPGDGEETVLGSMELNGPPKDVLGAAAGAPGARGLLRTSLILGTLLVNAHNDMICQEKVYAGLMNARETGSFAEWEEAQE